MERATGTEVYGCGTAQSTDITLNIQTTTGGSFSISVNGKNTVESLKKLVSKKLKVAKDRICLLHRERQLREGTLEENGLLDGSRVILLPSVEAGLLSQRSENSVMQALESLNETQVNDFLSGKSPLNLTMRLGDHMMLIQLQLSTLNSSSSSRCSTSKATPSTSQTNSPARSVKSDSRLTEKVSQCDFDAPVNSAVDRSKQEHQTILDKQDIEFLKSAYDVYNSMSKNKVDDYEEKEEPVNNTADYTETPSEVDQSPIKSLSNLVSSPLDAAANECKEAVANSIRNSLVDLLSKTSTIEEPKPSTSKSEESRRDVSTSPFSSPHDTSSNDSDTFLDQSNFLAENTIDEYPMENLFNNAVDKGLFEDQDEPMDREISNLATTSHGTQESTSSGPLPSFHSVSEPMKTKRFQYLLHKTSKLKHPINRNKQKAFMQSVVNKHKKRMQIKHDNTLSASRTEPFITNSRKLLLQPSGSQTIDSAVPSTSKQATTELETAKKAECASPTPEGDSKDLIEASKNLTQKLRKLSKEVLTNKIDLRAAEESVRSKIGPGAVIESMKHHGKGIYSGTFSGTLNPALQDRYGRPKRDISTIIHILNDLLCASPPINLPQKDSKHSCPATVVTEENKCNCGIGLCTSHGRSIAPRPTNCTACGGGDPCDKCDSAKTRALENNKTKCKLEQLRLVMQQKKQRREARKLKTLPYPASPPRALPSPEPTAHDEIETLA